MMFLANENFPRPSVSILREHGYSIKSIQEECPGIADSEVVELALAGNLIILTFDRDYGEIVFKYGSSRKPNVVYFREKGADPEFAGKILLALLISGNINFHNAFTVIEQKNLRQRFY